MEAGELQQQLHGDGLHQEHCVQCSQRISSVTMLESGGHPDAALTSAFVIMTSLRDHQERQPMYQMHLSRYTSTCSPVDMLVHSNTHTHLTALFLGLPR